MTYYGENPIPDRTDLRGQSGSVSTPRCTCPDSTGDPCTCGGDDPYFPYDYEGSDEDYEEWLEQFQDEEDHDSEA